MIANTSISDIRLLATDLDGTLLGQKPEFQLYNPFRDTLSGLRTGQQMAWAVCTGRTMKSFTKVFMPMRSFGIVPDFVITSHAYIYSMTPLGYRPHWAWNIRVKQLQWRHLFLVRRAIPRLRRLVGSRFPFARIVAQGQQRICFGFDSPEFADAAAEIVRTAVQPYRYLRVFEYHNQVDVRSVPFTKGLALGELARHLRLSPQQILAVGNGQNDTSMMDRTVARYCACPANAEPEVMTLVHRNGGHIARKRYLSGVMETIEAYRTGTVCSELPGYWRDPTTIDSPVEAHSPRRSRDRSSALRPTLIFVAALYAVLLVMANFGMLHVPVLPTLVMKPYQVILALAERLLI